MALSTNEIDLIDAASPINNQYQVGERIGYRTFQMDIKTAVGATGSSAFASSTSDQMTNGVYTLSTDTIHRVSSAHTAGDRVVCWNPTTATTQYVIFSTDGGVTCHDTGDCVAALTAQQSINAIAMTTAKWVLLGFTSGSSGGLGENLTLSSST